MSENKNKRIAKNTLMLFIRMLFILGITLYISRIVLLMLGVEDFGLYSVVAGVVIMISFIKNALTASVQRFLNFELGKNNLLELSRVFSMSLNIHVIIAVIIVILAETVGIWLLNTHLTIPLERLSSSQFVYHFSVAAVFISIITVPYNAIIIAHERMSVYAFISVLEVVLKLALVLLIQWMDFDKLEMYAISLFVVTINIQSIYVLYCIYNFKESKYFYFFDIKLFKAIISYTGWNMFGQFATVVRNQGSNIVLNIFFGTMINAAHGVSSQLNNAVSSLVTNFQIALRPQIVKSYASGDSKYMLELIFKGAKYSFFLMYIISFPIIIEAKSILILWLKEVPNHTVMFTRLILINALIDSLTSTLMMGVQATGKIKVYQLVISFLMLSSVPVSYLLFSVGYPPEASYFLIIIVTIIIFVFRILIVSFLLSFSIKSFIKKVVVRVFGVISLSILAPLLFIYKSRFTGIPQIFSVFVLTSISVLICIYLVGLTKEERIFFKKKIGSTSTILYKN